MGTAARWRCRRSVLYTSLERDGAIAEVVSFLAALTPIPGPRQINVTRLAVSTSHTLRLVREPMLGTLGVDLDRYGERDYGRTQEIGAALVFLGFDGLIAPSARWPCDNLMIFGDNHALTETLEPIGTDKVEWLEWARSHGILPDTPDAIAETPTVNGTERVASVAFPSRRIMFRRAAPTYPSSPVLPSLRRSALSG